MYCYEYPHPALTTDVVLFSLRDDRLKLLLIQRASDPCQGMWALPGGFVDIDEDLEDCAKRELAEETGITDVYLEQLYTFGRPGRDPRERVVSVAYYALAPSERMRPRAASDAADVAWYALNELPPLAFDHDSIITLAHTRLVAKLKYSTLGFQFMPDRFTLSEMQRVYETLFNEPLDKRNFRKWVLSLERIEATDQMRRNGNHRPARLYRVKNPDQVDIIK